MRRHSRLLILALGISAAIGCHGYAVDYADNPYAGSDNVSIAPASAILQAGDSVRFVAGTSITSSPEWVWTSSDPLRLDISPTGMAHAFGPASPTLHICAALKTDSTKKACATVAILTQ